jgi:endonuclease/exonuclease/phosphatase family metal-dependent hydrolase
MQIDVMQWNVWFEEDIEKVVDVLKEHDSDIVCLQELTQGYREQKQDNTWEYISRELGFYAVHQSMPVITDSDRWIQANAIFSRSPIIFSKKHWIYTPQDVDSGEDQSRGYIEAVIDTQQGLQFTTGTAQMSFGQTPNEAETNELARLLGQKERRYIFAADTNATPESDRMKKIGQYLVHAGPPFNESTWTTKPHITPNYVATELNTRYDYVFTTPDVEVIEARIIETDVSDHLPIIVTAELS